MKKETEKLCINCKHHNPDAPYGFFYDAKCRRTQKTYNSLVTGEPFIMGEVLDCYSERKNIKWWQIFSKRCGREGRYFEERQNDDLVANFKRPQI